MTLVKGKAGRLGVWNGPGSERVDDARKRATGRDKVGRAGRASIAEPAGGTRSPRVIKLLVIFFHHGLECALILGDLPR